MNFNISWIILPIMSILIQNAIIITQNHEREQLCGDILIHNNKIAEISNSIDKKAPPSGAN